MFRNLKIKTKIFIAFFITGLILTSIGVAVFYYSSTEFIKTAIYDSLEGTAESSARHVETFLEDKKILAENLALIGKVEKVLLNSSDVNVLAVEERLQKTVDSVEEIASIAVINELGIIIVSTNKNLVGIDRSKNEAFLYGKEYTYIQGVNFTLEGTEEPIMFVSTPVMKDNKLLGVVVMRLTTKKLNAIILYKTRASETGELYLINEESYAITPLLFTEDAILKQKIDNAGSRDCLKDLKKYYIEKESEVEKHEEEVKPYLDYRGKKVIGTHAYVAEMKWCLMAEIDEEEALSPLRWIFWIAIGLSLFLFITIYSIANWISRKISKSIIDLRHGAEIIGKGDLDYKVVIDSKDEIGDLSRAFNNMVLDLKEAKKDVDKKVKEQTKLIREQRDKISTVLHSIGDGVFVVDRDFKITVFNKEAVNISGFSEKEVIGKKYDETLKFILEKNGEVNSEFIKKAMQTGKIVEMSNHTILITKNGKKVAIADSSAPIKDKNGKIVGCVAVFRDVSRERRISQMESEFVSVASHQLRTPITAIQWLMEIVLRKEKISKKGREYLDGVHSSAIRLNALVDLLLNVSKVEAGKIDVSFAKSEIVEIVKRCLDESKALFAKKEITVVFKEYPKTLNVVTDNNLFRNILQSLISNAVEYTLKKGKIEVSLEKKPKSFVLIVSDTGIGIPKKEQATIFDKFTRASNAKLMKTDGTGLGLYFTKQVVGLLGGKIWLESEKDKGTAFYVELPLNLKTKAKD